MVDPRPSSGSHSRMRVGSNGSSTQGAGLCKRDDLGWDGPMLGGGVILAPSNEFGAYAERGKATSNLRFLQIATNEDIFSTQYVVSRIIFGGRGQAADS